MTFILIGFVVGIVMGLTGAGGALISIPLFLNLLHSTLKEATVLSLLAVILGTSINLVSEISKVDRKITITFSLFGIGASYIASGWKNLLPDLVVAGLLFLIAAYSLWSVWTKSTSQASEKEVGWVALIFTGLFLGAVTTFTGLGGGVLLIPILIKVFGKSYEDALPTSLASILFISLGSFLFQFETASALIEMSDIVLMFLGSGASYAGLSFFLKKIPEDKTSIIRKSVFTLVTIYAISNVIIKVLGGQT